MLSVGLGRIFSWSHSRCRVIDTPARCQDRPRPGVLEDEGDRCRTEELEGVDAAHPCIWAETVFPCQMLGRAVTLMIGVQDGGNTTDVPTRIVFVPDRLKANAACSMACGSKVTQYPASAQTRGAGLQPYALPYKITS